MCKHILQPQTLAIMTGSAGVCRMYTGISGGYGEEIAFFILAIWLLLRKQVFLFCSRALAHWMLHENQKCRTQSSTLSHALLWFLYSALPC